MVLMQKKRENIFWSGSAVHEPFRGKANSPATRLNKIQPFLYRNRTVHAIDLDSSHPVKARGRTKENQSQK